MARQKNSIFNTILYTFGTLLIAALVVVVATNFARDARAFQKPLLSAADENQDSSPDPDGYKTIKYVKPTQATSKPTTKPTDKPSASTRPATTPTTRADP